MTNKCTIISQIITLYKTNAQITKELQITQILDKLLEYKRSWIQRVNRMPRNRLPRVMKYYSPTGRRNHGRTLKRLLDTWDRNGSLSGPTPWQMYDDDDDKNSRYNKKLPLLLLLLNKYIKSGSSSCIKSPAWIIIFVLGWSSCTIYVP